MVAWLQMLQGTLAMNEGDYQKSETLLTNAQTYWEAQKDASPRWKAAVNNRLAALRLAQHNLESEKLTHIFCAGDCS